MLGQQFDSAAMQQFLTSINIRTYRNFRRTVSNDSDWLMMNCSTSWVVICTSAFSSLTLMIKCHNSAISLNFIPVVTHAGCIAAGVGRAFSRVCLSVCLFVCALTGKRLELSTPNFVHVYSIAVARHALTQRSKGQRSRSHGYENRHGRTVASDHDRCRRGFACQYNCLCFVVFKGFFGRMWRPRHTVTTFV